MHVRLDLVLDLTRAYAQHDSECPEIGPQCRLGPVPPQQHRTTLWLSSLRLFAEYGLQKNLALQAVTSLRFADTRTRFTDLEGNPIESASIHHRDETLIGPGDAQLLIHGARFFGGTAVGVRGGVSIPIGRTEPDPYLLGEQGIAHEHLQFGTGTMDPIFGLDVARSVGPIGLGAFAFTQVPLISNVHGFQAGPVVNGGISAAYSRGITYRLSVLALHEWAERWNGVVPDDDGNQGRTDLFVSPGVTIPFATDWSASVDLRIRAYGQTVGAQLELPAILQLSIGRLVHLEDDEEAAHPDELGNVEEWVTNGEARELSGVPGKFVVYDFWAPWCDACRAVDRDLRELAEKRPDVIIRRVNIVDFDSEIAKRELPGVDVLPHVRVIGPDGAQRVDQSGPATDVVRSVEEAVQLK